FRASGQLGLVVDCAQPRNVGRSVVERARAGHRVTIAPEAARMLVELIGVDLGRLDSEIAKLAIGAGDTGGRITAQKVGETVAFQREQEMWDMTNALAAGEPAEALRRWRQLVQLDPSAEFRAVTWLGMWLEDV